LTPIFIDTEFSGLHQNAQLISLALVPENGPWFYAVLSDVDTETLPAWHQQNIVPQLLLTDEQLAQLPPGHYFCDTKENITKALLKFLAGFDQVTMWADVPAYDWVLFCELFGGAFGLPKNIHYIVRDLATLLEAKGYNIDTDRFALAYGNLGEDAGAEVSSSDGRVGGQASATTAEGVLRHNALGDALTAKACWQKIIGYV
jgi:hypothetical protein